MQRSFVRPSGTEDVVRVYGEAPTEEAAVALTLRVMAIVHQIAGGVCVVIIIAVIIIAHCYYCYLNINNSESKGKVTSGGQAILFGLSGNIVGAVGGGKSSVPLGIVSKDDG